MSRPDELGLEVIQFQKIRPSGIFSFIVLRILGILSITQSIYLPRVEYEFIYSLWCNLFSLCFTFWLLQSHMPHSKPLFYWGKQVWLTASNWNEKEIPICSQWAKNGKKLSNKWICSTLCSRFMRFWFMRSPFTRYLELVHILALCSNILTLCGF